MSLPSALSPLRSRQVQSFNDLQKECFRFIWNGKQDRINRKSTIKDIRNGGFNVPDIKNYMIALKLTWIRKLKTTNHKWKNILTELYPFLDRLECYGPCFLSLNAKGNSFWTDTFKAYNIFFSRIKPNSTIEVLSEPVFYNENIKIGNKVIKHTKWIENGVYCIANFLRDNGQFFTIAEFNARFGLTVDFLTFSGCICSMKLRRILRS